MWVRLCLLTVCLAPAALADGWTLNKMAAVYGSGRRSYPKWSVNSNNSDINSIGGGVSEYFGAGGSTPIVDEDDFDVSPGRVGPLFGQPGSRTTMKRQHKPPKPLDILLNKLWASSILRDNMVTVFGYILNLPDNPLNTEMYTSLYRIYDLLRFRRLQTAELVPFLKEMSAVSPTKQFKILFRELGKNCPQYLESDVQVWTDSLESNSINIDAIVRPDGGPLLVDFLAGIEPSVLKVLEMKVKFNQSTIDAASSHILETLGPLLANTFSAIKDGSFPMTQPLFALILLHRPLNYLAPEWVETVRFIIDVLRLNNVKHWDEILKKAERSRGLNPFAYGRDILRKIAEHPDLPQALREAAARIVSFMKTPQATYSNIYYDYTSQMMSRPTIDVLLMLKAIHKYEYAEDVVEAKNRLEYYILSGYVDTEYLVKGFNRFDHARPINILIAILTRAELRLSKLPKVILSSIKYLKANLIFKKFLCSMFPNIPDDFLEVSFLVDSFSAKGIPTKIRDTVEKLSELLPEEKIPAEELLKDITLEQCSKPRMCIMNMYRRIIKKGYLEGKPALEHMKELVKSLDIEGNPIVDHATSEENLSGSIKKCRKKLKPKKTCPKRKFRITNTPLLPPTTTMAPNVDSDERRNRTSERSRKVQGTDIEPDEPMSFNVTLNSTSHIPVSQPIYYYERSVKEIYISSIAFTEPIPLYPVGSEECLLFPVMNSSEENERPDYGRPEFLIPPAPPFTPEDIKLRPLRVFLSQRNLYKILGRRFRPYLYLTKGRLIRAILKRALSVEYIRYDMTLYSAITEYLAFLDYSPSRPELICKQVFPPISSEFEEEPVDPREPITLLPEVPPGSEEFEKLQPLRRFLMDINLYMYLGVDFQPRMYATRGMLVRAIFSRAISVPYVRENFILSITIRQYLKHLDDSQMNIMSMTAVSFPQKNFVLDHEPANWKHIETLLPPTNPGTPEHMKLRPLRLFLSQPNFMQLMGPDFHPEDYRTKGKLLRAILRHCLTLQFVQYDRPLYQLITEYLNFLDSTSGPARSAIIGVNSQTIIKALPPPSNEDEEQMLMMVQQLLVQPTFQRQVIQQNIDLDVYKTRGEVLKDILGKALEIDTVVSNPQLQSALSFFKERVYTEGYGAQSVDYVVIQEKTTSLQFDVFNVFRAIDNDALDSNGKAAVKRIIDFVSYKFNPSVYLADFDFKQHRSKGEFLRAAFRTMISHSTINTKVKSDMTFIMSHILDTGPGAEPVDYQPEEQLS